MPMSQAVRLCPGLIVVPHHFNLYHAASHAVMERLNNTSPFVEQISIDEAFLDGTGLRESGESLAQRLQTQIHDELGLPCSFGVATSKLVAKIANNVGKADARGDAPPNAITIVHPGREAEFLAPLPIRELWGVGAKTAEKLAEMGIRTIGDLARCPEAKLTQLFGKNGTDMARHARGMDTRPVEPERETKSISKETTFTRDEANGDTLRRTLRQLAEGVGRQVRKEHLRGSTIKIKLRWSDFTTLTRQITLPQPTDQDHEIIEAAQRLFNQFWPRGKPVRLIGVGISGFDNAGTQLELWQQPASQDAQNLQNTLDKLRDRFGDSVIKRASDMDED